MKFHKTKVIFISVLSSFFINNTANAINLHKPPINKIVITTSFSILTDFVKNIVKDRAIVNTLIQDGQDLHEYELKPSDVVNASKSKLFILNGYNLESNWINILAKSYKGKVVNVAELLENPIYLDKNHKIIDPHAWNDPLVVVDTYIPNILKSVCDIDSKNCKFYKQNAKNYINLIKNMHNNLLKQINRIDIKERRAVITHDAFNYFMRRYNINFLIIPEVENGNLSIKNLISLESKIKHDNIDVVFFENNSYNKLLQQISKDLHLEVGGTLCAESLTTKNHKLTYIAIMQNNMNLLIKSWNEEKELSFKTHKIWSVDSIVSKIKECIYVVTRW